jgi:hypothetical protein
MIEVPLKGTDAEQIHGLLTQVGMALVETYNQRDGHLIGDIRYEKWRRASP